MPYLAAIAISLSMSGGSAGGKTSSRRNPQTD